MSGSIQLAIVLGVLVILTFGLFYLILYAYNPPVDRKSCCEKICEKNNVEFHEIRTVEGSQMCIGKDDEGSIRDFEMNDEICEGILISNSKT